MYTRVLSHKHTPGQPREPVPAPLRIRAGSNVSALCSAAVNILAENYREQVSITGSGSTPSKAGVRGQGPCSREGLPRGNLQNTETQGPTTFPDCTARPAAGLRGVARET